MRIQTNAVEDFLENVKDGYVHQQTVYVQKTQKTLTKDPVRTSSSVQIGLQCSAVIMFKDSTEALLECGVLCGIDRKTSDGELEGSDEFNKLKSVLVDACEGMGLKIRPGVLDV